MEYPSYDPWEKGLQEFGGSEKLIHEVFEDAADMRNIFGLNLESQHFTKENLEIHEKVKNKKVGRIQTSKGCVARCTFCQRAQKGYRPFEPKYFEEARKILQNYSFLFDSYLMKNEGHTVSTDMLKLTKNFKY